MSNNFGGECEEMRGRAHQAATDVKMRPTLSPQGPFVPWMGEDPCGVFTRSTIDGAHDHECKGFENEPNGNDKHTNSCGAVQHFAVHNSIFPGLVNMSSSTVLRRKRVMLRLSSSG